MTTFGRIPLFLLALLTSSLSAQSLPPGLVPFDVEPFHSQIEFSVPFMGLARVKGGFEDFTGTLLYDPSRLENSSVTLIIQAASIHTGSARRDKHLASADFFEVEKYPVLVFESRRIERTGVGFTAHGLLTMHGITRPVTIPFTQRHPPVSESGVDYLGYDAALRLNWREFGIPATSQFNSWFQPAKMLVNDSVDVELSVSAVYRHLAQLHLPALDTLLSQVKVAGVQPVVSRYRGLAATYPDSVPRLASRLGGLGTALAEGGRGRDAVEVLKLAAELAPKDGDTEAALGAAYSAAGQPDLALAAYQAALQLDPYQPLAREMLRRLKS